jgi:hypothetical protein
VSEVAPLRSRLNATRRSIGERATRSMRRRNSISSASSAMRARR